MLTATLPCCPTGTEMLRRLGASPSVPGRALLPAGAARHPPSCSSSSSSTFPQLLLPCLLVLRRAPDVCPCLFCILSVSAMPLCMRQSRCTGGLFGGRVITVSFVLFASKFPAFDGRFCGLLDNCAEHSADVFLRLLLPRSLTGVVAANSDPAAAVEGWGFFFPALSFSPAPFPPLFYYLAAPWQEVPLDSSRSHSLSRTAKSPRAHFVISGLPCGEAPFVPAERQSPCVNPPWALLPVSLVKAKYHCFSFNLLLIF